MRNEERDIEVPLHRPPWASAPIRARESSALGTSKGTCDLVDWQKPDCLIVMRGQRPASNAPRMLTSLAEAYRRGASIVHVNPLVEAAARAYDRPHDILRMATFRSTRTSTLNVQPRIADDYSPGQATSRS